MGFLWKSGMAPFDNCFFHCAADCVCIVSDGSVRSVAMLINEISQGRLVPARYGTDPIAVNLVWLVEHMTVKPKNPRSVGS